MKVTQNGDALTVAHRVCGTQLPIMTTTAIAGGLKVAQDIPPGAFDSPSMPEAQGTGTRTDGVLSLKPGIIVVGWKTDDPASKWPGTAVAFASVSADSDGDGKPGVTAKPRPGSEFTLPPISILQTDRADELYSASRTQYVATVPDADCADTLEGTAEAKFSDQVLIGCHIQGGNDCVPEDADFINSARPAFKPGKGAWSAKVVPADTTCEQIRTMLPAAQ